MTIICAIKVDLIMCKPHCVDFSFLFNLTKKLKHKKLFGHTFNSLSEADKPLT